MAMTECETCQRRHGRDTKGRSSTYEQRDNCPTVLQWLWTSTVDNLFKLTKKTQASVFAQ